MKTFCGNDCCERCEQYQKVCPGCEKTGGHPCGGSCVAAECVKANGREGLEALKKAILAEVNGIGLPGLQAGELYLLLGSYVNLEYPFPGGQKAKLLDDGRVYFGCQIERAGMERCYGVAADEKILVVCEYGCGGSAPELLFFKRREPQKIG